MTSFKKGVSAYFYTNYFNIIFFSASTNLCVHIYQQRGKKRRKSSSTSDSSTSRFEDLSLVPPPRLLRRFSRCDSSELWRTFSYTCTFKPDTCGQTYSSFGGEENARRKMVAHIQGHIRGQKNGNFSFSISIKIMFQRNKAWSTIARQQ